MDKHKPQSFSDVFAQVLFVMNAAFQSGTGVFELYGVAAALEKHMGAELVTTIHRMKVETADKRESDGKTEDEK